MRTFIEALSQPALYPHPVERVRVIETHMSWVLLAGDHAYKVKKPVTLPFADFSTLDARHYYCQQELALNRRLAPELYEAVVAITGPADAPEIDGAGEIIDYAVRMRRFDQEQLFHRLLAREELAPELMRRLARRIAAFHDQLPAAGADSGYGTAATVLQPALDNFDEMARQQAPTRRDELERQRAWTEAQGKRLRPLFEHRRAEGFVRECHGDLHLGNIAQVGGEPVAFDCLEFSAELRWIDVINEVAFVVMDCIDRGGDALGFHFLDEYLQVRGDFEGIPLLRFYMVYRAMVRAKVQGLQAGQAEADGDTDRARQLARIADGYVELGQRLIATAEPALILMHGFSGSGKSRVAERLLGSLGAVRLRSDVERKRLFDLDAAGESGSSVGGGIYEHGASERTYDHLARQADAILQAGYPVIIDAAFLQQWQRARLEAVARRRGVELRIVDCHAEADELRRRVEARRRAGNDPSEATIEVLEHQFDNHESFTPDEEALVIHCDMNGDEASTIAACDERVRTSLTTA